MLSDQSMMHAPQTSQDPWAQFLARLRATHVHAGSANSGKDPGGTDINTHAVMVTFFRNEAAQVMRRLPMTLPQLAGHIEKQTAASKMDLPWLKLEIFGDKRSEKNCLRTNENVELITGIEGEHDAGTTSFDEAIAIIRKIGIRALLYTSPSHVAVTHERWRILIPLSKNYPPGTREKFVARINGIFNGALAPESFAEAVASLSVRQRRQQS